MNTPPLFGPFFGEDTAIVALPGVTVPPEIDVTMCGGYGDAIIYEAAISPGTGDVGFTGAGKRAGRLTTIDDDPAAATAPSITAVGGWWSVG